MEENEKKRQTITRSYRVDDETAEKITALAKELGVNQNGVFEVLLSTYELQQDAELVPDARKDVEAFISHLRSIQDAYHHIVSINVQTEERVRQEFQRRLENNDEQIADLLETKKRQLAEIEELKREASELAEQSEKQKQDTLKLQQSVQEKDKTIEDKQVIIDSLNARLPEQEKMDAKLKEFADEIQRLQKALSESEKAKLASESSAAKAVADLEIQKSQAEIDRKGFQKDLETAQKIASAELKSAIAEARQEERDKAQEKADKLMEKIEELRAQIDEQKDIIANLQN